MAAWISSIALSRPWLPLAAAALLAALTAPLWTGAPQALGVGPLGGAPPADLTIEVQASAAIGSRVTAVAVDATRSRLESDPGVASVRVVRGARAARLDVDLLDQLPGARREALKTLPAGIDPGPLTIEVGGAEAQLDGARDGLGGDLWRVVLLAVPFALLALSALAGWRWALAQLLSVVIAVMLSAALVRVLSAALDVSALALAVAGAVAVAAAVEAAWMLAHRAADLPAGAGRADRLEAAIAEGGRDALLWAGFAAPIGLLAGLSGFAQASGLTVGVISGLAGGAVAGWAVALAALGSGAATPRFALEPAKALAARLSLYGRGRRPPGVRWRRLLVDSAMLIATLIAVLAVAIAAYLLRDSLSGAFASEPPAGLGGAALACALTAALAIVAGRVGLSARIYREAASLGARPGQAAAITVEAGLRGALASGVLLGLLGTLLLLADLGAAGEFGVLLAAILIVDALVSRTLCAVCWARLR